MKDTTSKVDARYGDMLMQRSGEERLKMGCAMRETARAFVEASIREQDPQATPVAVRKGLFLRFNLCPTNQTNQIDQINKIDQPDTLSPSPTSRYWAR